MRTLRTLRTLSHRRHAHTGREPSATAGIHWCVAIGDNRASVLVLRRLGTGAFETPIGLPPLDPDTHVSDGAFRVLLNPQRSP